VKPLVEDTFASLGNVEVKVVEPTARYQNVAKRTGVQKLTPARALIAELVRRYWVLGIECSLLEIQKLAYFLERGVLRLGLKNELNLQYSANKFGPYSPRLQHLMDALDGSYLHCHKRLTDAAPMDVIWFEDAKADRVATYLHATEARDYLPALEWTANVIDGFESPLGMELLGTVDWLVHKNLVPMQTVDIKAALKDWPGGTGAAARKQRIFNDRLIELAIGRLRAVN